MRPAFTTVVTLSTPSVLQSLGQYAGKFLPIGTSLGYDGSMRRSQKGSPSDSVNTGRDQPTAEGDQVRREHSESTRSDSAVAQPAQGAHARAVQTREETHAERLARIKSEIESGTYDTPEKLDIAIDRMLGRLWAE